MNRIFFTFIILFLLPLLASCAQKQVYIVHFKGNNGERALHEIEETHHSYLLSVKRNEEEARASHLYSYKHSINGFSAVLTSDEASKLSELEEVASVYESGPDKYSMHTTRSWEFVGLDEANGGKYNWNHFNMGGDLLSKARYGQDVIVGVVDSGVWPDSMSFSDEGMGPVPKTWKGICQNGVAFNSSHCNKKIIGARYYLKGFEQLFGPLNATEDDRSPRDLDGHGTHTASTVAGRQVQNAEFLGGFARGTASGGAPLARLAIYKACWATPNASKANGNTCFEADMLAAIDDAITDGVHVLSISIGTTQPYPYNKDGIAIGGLNAVKNNIVVSCSAGNAGPFPYSLTNMAPWIITVGASSLDRDFFAPVVLGNGMELMGKTVTPFKLKKMHPLVYAEDAVLPGVPQNESNQCLPGSLSPEKVKGKIVLCMRGIGLRLLKGIEVKRAGGVGLILGSRQEDGNEYNYDAHYLPATEVLYDDFIRILEYIKSSHYPLAFISHARTLYYQPAPFMATFTSRGPNSLDPYILKPDITAPGLYILAAWSEGSSPTKNPFDNRTVKYNLFSGTSMACPHVAAAAALLKAIHPNWSSAAIRSALMTTAWRRNNKGFLITNADGSLATPFSFGAGHFRPTKAADPGLVYDASYEDYLLYVCSKGLNFTDVVLNCPNEKFYSALDLNYPSIAIPSLDGTVSVKRTVTNVGGGKSVYFFSAEPPLGVRVEANPSILFFDHVGQKKSFTICVSLASEGIRQSLGKEYVFGWFSWIDGLHQVRSPLAVAFA